METKTILDMDKFHKLSTFPFQPMKDSFIYYRPLGITDVNPIMHNTVWCEIIAYHYGFYCYEDMDDDDLINKVGVPYDDIISKYLVVEHFLGSTPGTAYKSSAGDDLIIGRKGNLSPLEQDYLYTNGKTYYIFKD